MTFNIGTKRISSSDPVYFIAEIGSNHDGSLQQAKDLIDAACLIGADAVKFQSFSAEQLVVRSHPAFDTLKKLELPKYWHLELATYAHQHGLDFLSTPFDEQKVQWLEEAGVRAYKIASGDMTYHRLLEVVARLGKPLLLATGIATLEEVQTSVRVIEASGNEQIAVLHCVSNYPPADEDLHLNALSTLRRAFPAYVLGLSDHSSGDVGPLGAVTLGARIIEKHITLSRGLKGPDHPYALEVEEFGVMISRIRRLEKMLGQPDKQPVQAELPEVQGARRGIYLRRPLTAGSVIEENDLAFLRPNAHWAAEHYQEVVGKRLKYDRQAGQALDQESIVSP